MPHRLIDLLTLDTSSGATASGRCHAGAPGRAFGGQVAAQALVAAANTVSPDRQVHAMHAHYVGPGKVDAPIDYHVETLLEGGSFSTREVRAQQSGTLLAVVTASFGRPGVGGPEVHSTQPAVSSPEASASTLFPDTESGRQFTRVVEQRVALDEASDAQDVPRERRWIRGLESLGDNPVTHAAALAYMSDIRMATIPAARLRENGHRLAITTLNHSIWWHRPPSSDCWLLFDQRGTSLSHGLGLATADFYSRGGALVASVSQQALIRSWPP